MNDDVLSQFPIAQPWSLVVGQIGRIFVFSGLALFLAAMICSALSGRRPNLVKPSSIGFVVGSITLFGAFICLGTLFATDQFQYAFVTEHGDVHSALQYKIAGIWSGQEGSFLLWAVTSAVFGLLTFRGTGPYRPAYVAVYSGFLATLCGILVYETPFAIMPAAILNGKVHVPVTGVGLEPALMNYWVTIHPPTIFTGFGSLTVFFAYAAAAIFHRNITDWVSRVRPWAMVSTAILGVGITMGGLWAYETLGWGGFWGWDPVENASFVPWLCVVALVHGLIVQTTRKRWFGINLWLGALPFLTFCYGTFLTRGGYLDKVSVHSFVSMDKSALTILKLFLLLVFVGYAVLYFVRGRKLASAAEPTKPPEVGLNRETMYGAGMLFLSMLATVVAIGMSWPLLMALSGRKVAKIDEPVYHKIVVWFFVPIMLLIAIAPFVPWKTLGFRALVQRIANIFSFAVAITGITLLLLRIPDWGIQTAAGVWIPMPFHRMMSATPWIAILFLICAFAFVANVWRIVETVKRSPTGIGGFVAHLGIATLFAGMIMSRGFEQKQQIFVQGGRSTSALGYTIDYKGLDGKSEMDPDEKAKFDIVAPSGETFTATPGLYFRPQPDGAPKPMVWPYVRRYAAHDFYFSMGEPIVTAWDDPVSFKQGETKTVRDVTVTYKKFEMTGQPGTSSAKFGAKLHIAVDGGQYDVTPTFSVGSGPDMPQFSPDFKVSVMGINPADRSVQIQIFFAQPIFPIELFTKPLTFLVWMGAGIMAIGSLLAAWSRRRRPAVAAEAATKAETTVEPEPPKVPAGYW